MGTRGTLGIVRECYSMWERRAPLTPTHVEKLVKAGSRVLVQPCNRRVFANEEYAAAGARVTDDLSEATAIFGVKQVPVENLLPGRAYMFFSHVIKAQPENMVRGSSRSPALPPASPDRMLGLVLVCRDRISLMPSGRRTFASSTMSASPRVDKSAPLARLLLEPSQAALV